MSQQLKSRLDKIEQSLAMVEIARKYANCSCRHETRFHSPEELERILALPCPVHGVRDPGFVCDTASWEPINKADWEFCDCPPNLMRDMKMGRVPLPYDPEERRRRKEELKQEERNRPYLQAEKDIQPPPERDFKEWKAKLRDVLRKHEQKTAIKGRFNGC